MTAEEIRKLIRSIPDFPQVGILFRDVTTLIGHGRGFAAAVDWLTECTRDQGADVVVGIEARGFIFGAPVAAALRLPFVPVRKPGKLPVEAISTEYALEYGFDRLELDPLAIEAGQRVVVIDDLLATGGTAEAAVRLVREAGGMIDLALFVVELPDLGGATRLAEGDISAKALVAFEGH